MLSIFEKMLTNDVNCKKLKLVVLESQFRRTTKFIQISEFRRLKDLRLIINFLI